MKKLIIKHVGFNRVAIVLSVVFGLYSMFGNYPNFGYEFFVHIFKFVMSNYFPDFTGFNSFVSNWILNIVMLLGTIFFSLIAYLTFKIIEWVVDNFKNNKLLSKWSSLLKWFLAIGAFLMLWNIFVNFWKSY